MRGASGFVSALGVFSLCLLAVGYGCGDPSVVGLPGTEGGAPDDPDAGAEDVATDAKRDGDAKDAGRDAPSGPATVTLGAKDRIVLVGTVVTPETTLDGEVLVEGARITCVGNVGECTSRPAADGATVIETQGIIFPGLVDTHNHILFDVFDDDDWFPAQAYVNHKDWTAEDRYKAMLDTKQCLANDSQGKPAWCTQTPYGTPAGSLRCEMDKWGELKGLVAGTTSIVGLPGTSANCFSSLARSIDVPQSGLGTDHIQTAAVFPPSDPSSVCTNFSTGKTTAYLVHCGEGTDGESLDEFGYLGGSSSPPNCLYASQTAITHGTSFGATEFATMAAAGMKLIWSPRSNVSLYGSTTDIPAALDAGVTVALAPDWSMGGSQNLLDELRFAGAWDDASFGDRLSSRDLVLMATKNAAQVLALEGTIGVLTEGALADIAVIRGDRSAPYDAIASAQASDVRLVMVNGVALYGDRSLVAVGPDQPGCEDLDVCGEQKFVCVATTNTQNKLDQDLATIKGALEQAMTTVDALTPQDTWNFAPLAPLVRCTTP